MRTTKPRPRQAAAMREMWAQKPQEERDRITRRARLGLAVRTITSHYDQLDADQRQRILDALAV